MSISFLPGYFYYLDKKKDGLAIGYHNGHYKIFRVYLREDGELFHFCLAIMPSARHASILMDYLEDEFGPVHGDHKTIH